MRTQSWVPADPALGTGARQPGLGAFADQGALELGRGAQNLQRELALRGSGVDRVLNGTEEGALGLQPLDHLQQMRQRPRKSVDPHDDQRVALATRSSTRASTGRARLPPEACSSWISAQPADFRACDWGRGV